MADELGRKGHTTATPAAAAVHRHLLQLRRDDSFRLFQNGKELTRRLCVVGGEVGVRRAFHASTLCRNISI
jgi:hypothetical protein